MGTEKHGGTPHAAAELIDALRAMETNGIPHPKAYVMTVLQAAKTSYAAGDAEQGKALCERAWEYTESVPVLNHDREVAVHVYDAGWDHRRPRDPNYLTGAFVLACGEFGPSSGWVPHLMRELQQYVQAQGGWCGFGSLQDPELVRQIREIALAGLDGFHPGTDVEQRRRRGEVAGYATALLFSSGDDRWRSALQEWFGCPAGSFEPATALFSFLLAEEAYEPAREVAERTLQAVDANPASTDAEKASTVLDVAYCIAMAPDGPGRAQLPELEQRAGELAHGSFTEREAFVLQGKLSRYVNQHLGKEQTTPAARQAMFDRLRFTPSSAGTSAGYDAGS